MLPMALAFVLQAFPEEIFGFRIFGLNLDFRVYVDDGIIRKNVRQLVFILNNAVSVNLLVLI